MLRYRDLLRVEQLFRQAKAVLATRPIYHSSDMAIRGHVFCSFLALLLVKELEDRLHRHNIAAEWDDILRDLDRVQEIELEQDGKRFLLRTRPPASLASSFRRLASPCRPRDGFPVRDPRGRGRPPAHCHIARVYAAAGTQSERSTRRWRAVRRSVNSRQVPLGIRRGGARLALQCRSTLREIGRKHPGRQTCQPWI